LQAFALDDSRPIPGDTLADQFSYLSSRIAALNTRGLIKVQISDSHWVEFRAPDIWTTRLTTVQILLLACLWIGILSTVAGVMSAYIMRHFNRITTYAGALLNTKPPPLLSEKSGPIEVREMSAALNLVNHDIAASIAERTHFLAAISHDLRTPVTRMRLRTEQIDDTSVSKKLLSDLDEITNMISEAINFLRDGVEEEELENVLFATFVRSICDDYIDVGKNVVFEEIEPLQMRSTGTIFDPRTVVYDIKSPRNITLQCQPNRLRRAINNLIDNALKYGDAARVRIEADATSIMVRINDQGSGLDADQMELVFQPFYRVERSRNRSHGGAGLGLPLAKSVIEAHGGTITLFNHDRGGLEVRMVLPRTM
jgi:signal transduction histidine kinase